MAKLDTYAVKATPVGADLVLATDSSGNTTKNIYVGALSRSLSVINVKDPMFGATGDGVTDDTTSVQAAINTANTTGGAIVMFPKGTYNISSTLTLKRGAVLLGAQGYSAGSAGAAERPVELAWTGAANTDFITTDTIGGSRAFKYMKDLFIRKLSTAPNLYRHGVIWTERLDSFSGMENIQVGNCSGNGIRLMNGAINGMLHKCRIDNCAGYAIYYVLKNPDQFHISDMTWDNVGQTGSGGYLHVDGTQAVSNQWLYLTLSGVKKLEPNQNLATGEAVIKLEGPSTPVMNLFRVVIDQMWVTPGGGVTEYTGLKVTPASDLVSIQARGSMFSISGIPSFTGSKTGTKFSRPNLMIHPHTTGVGTLTGLGSAEMAPALEVVGDLSLINGQTYINGDRAAMAIAKRPVAAEYSSPLTVEKDMQFKWDAAAASPYAISTSTTTITWASCTGAGTLGTLTGVTIGADTSTSSQTVTLAGDISGLRLNQYITFGSQNKRVTGINYSNNTISVNSNPGAIVTAGTAVSYTAPTFKTWTVTSLGTTV